MKEIDELALNEAAWRFIELYIALMDATIQPKLFNNIKPLLRETIEVYLKEESYEKS